MRIYLIRHGMTAGNTRRAYIGSTDEPLCKEGIAAVRASAPKIRAQTGFRSADDFLSGGGLLAVSPMKRCIQTAELLFPDARQQVVTDFRECDFGVFEGRNADEMTGDPDFQRWIDANGETAFPGGEDPTAFKARVCGAFAALTDSLQAPEKDAVVESAYETAYGAESVCTPEQIKTLIIAAHGGTIMAILERYAVPHQPFYRWHVGNAQGYAACWDGAKLTDVRAIG